MAGTPKVKAFLICDQVIRSTDGKYSIIGIFRRVHAPQFPVFHARFGVYMMLGELNGAYDFTILFTDPAADSPERSIMARAELRGVKHARPLEDFEAGINLPGLSFPREGTFEIHIQCNGELLHVDTLHAIRVEPPAPPPMPS